MTSPHSRTEIDAKERSKLRSASGQDHWDFGTRPLLDGYVLEVQRVLLPFINIERYHESSSISRVGTIETPYSLLHKVKLCDFANHQETARGVSLSPHSSPHQRIRPTCPTAADNDRSPLSGSRSLLLVP